ncbi:MAG: NAD(P)H-hydrate dehydratase [Bacillota bacterium]|nr:NAD(P)H-hydrate dehydratase [Bacillota bacterium]
MSFSPTLTIGARGTKALDRAIAGELGIPTLLLMDRAAAELRRVLEELFAERGIPARRALVFIACGTGGNGGDGLALARHLTGLVQRVEVYSLDPEGERTSGDAAVMFRSTQQLDIPIFSLAKLADSITAVQAAGAADRLVLVDAVYGAGFDPDRPVAPAFAAYCRTLARHPELPVLACDLPSGVAADDGRLASPEAAVRATVTASFLFASTGNWTWPGRAQAGRIVTCRLGVPDAWLRTRIEALNDPWTAVLLDAPHAARLLAPMAADAHKGRRGHALLAAGSWAYPGAALLAVRAAHAGGAGLVTAMTTPELARLILQARPETLIRPWPDTAPLDAFAALAAAADAVLVGPGLDAGPAPGLPRLPLVMTALRHARRLILDADALNALAQDGDLETAFAALGARTRRGQEPAVLTPHPGEFARLQPFAPGESRLAAARRLALATGSIVVLKGAGTVIAHPDPAVPLRINSSGNAGLARGGSGDLLGGLMLALCVNDLPLTDAVELAVWLHGDAADRMLPACGERDLVAEDWLTGLRHSFQATAALREEMEAP